MALTGVNRAQLFLTRVGLENEDERRNGQEITLEEDNAHFPGLAEERARMEHGDVLVWGTETELIFN